jgi:hypothetical protein
MSVVTTKAATPAANIQEARVLVDVEVASRNSGAGGMGAKTDFSERVFIFDVLHKRFGFV